MRTGRKGMRKYVAILAVLAVSLSLFSILANADPAGTSITANSTSNGPASTPSNRSDEGGTITSMILDAVQQNTNWKAYVGNITGTLTLDDSTGATIYAWSLASSGITGEVYASRAISPTWSSIACTSAATVGTEHTALGFSGGDVDSITNTFNESTHAPMVTAGITIGANTCNATATYESDSKPATQAGANFQEILLHDTSNLIYATAINQDTTTYDGSTTADFQFIVPDNPSITNTTYYFFAEISG